MGSDGTAAHRPSSERTAVVFLLVLSAALFVALRWPCAAMPLERDEGAYAYVAQQMLAGAVPYRDVFDHKPPGIYLAYLLPVGLFGTSVVAIHVAAYLATALTALFLFLVVRRLAGPLAAACSVAIFGVVTIEPSYLATAANTEQFLLLPMVASVWCLLRAEETRGGGWWAATGALAAASCWIKPVAVTHVLFLAALESVRFASRRQRGPWMALVTRAAWAAAGAAAVTAPILAYFAWKGAWKDFADALFAQNLEYVGRVPFSAGVARLAGEIRGQAPGLWLIWLASAAAILDWRRGRRRAALLLAGALLSAAAGIAVGGNFYGHYFLQAAPALSAAAGLAIARAMTWISGMVGQRLSAISWLAAPGVLLPGLLARAFFFFGMTPAEKVGTLYWPNPFDVSPVIADRIRERTGPDDTVFIAGSEPQIFFLARRRSATRYVVFYPLTSTGPKVEARQRQAWEEIRKSPPRAILATRLAQSLLEAEDSPRFLSQQIGRMLQSGWALDGLRVFSGRRGRMVFGREAEETLAEARRSSSPPYLDMFLFFRR